MKKILIIDDEPDFCHFLKLNLELNEEFKATVCVQSTEAAQVAEMLQPDVVFLDFMMPGISGTEVAEKLRNNPKTNRIPIVFLTAVTGQEKALENQRKLEKPVEMETLLKTVEEVTAA